MATKIEIKNWKTGKVIFSYECEDNTIKKTVEEAVRQDISLKYVDLEDADLNGANLMDADLRFACLHNAVLTNANLSGADLSFADLNRANLSNADLRFSDLHNTHLDNADLDDAKINYLMNIPDGEFIAWKKVYSHENGKQYIIKLKILADSKRSRATTDKCRCDKALVLEIQDVVGNKLDLTEIINNNFTLCTYKVGEIVYADSWDENRFNECSHGIHFFLDRQKAVEY